MTPAIGEMSLLQAVDLYARRWKRSYESRRKIVLIFFGFVFLLYFVPFTFRSLRSSGPPSINSEISVLERQLLPFLREEQSLSSFISRSWISGSKKTSDQIPPLPDQPEELQVTAFIGNGKIGLSLDQDSPLVVRSRRGLQQELPFHPIVRVDLPQSRREFVTVSRIVEGVVNKISAFPYVGSTAIIHETIYAHRLVSSLLVQELSVNNPSEVPLILAISRIGWKGKSSLKSESISVTSKDAYLLSEGEVRTQNANLVFVIAAPTLPDRIEVPAKQKKSFVFRTFVNYSMPTPQTRAAVTVTSIKNTLIETVRKVSRVASSSLLRYHSEVWHNLWNSGFGISYSRADGALNGGVINATIYYILSQTTAFSSDANFLTGSEMDDSRTDFFLNHPDRCYAGNPTLQAPNLWSSLQTFNQMQKVVSLWLLTLEKNGCRNLMSAGAEGTMQAIILSFVGMQFHQNHLEMGIHPKELHRDYFLRRVRYSNRTSINVTMSVGEDNKASIYVVLDKNTDGQDFFACDAGCLDDPVVLTTSLRQLPVKITEPLTAILYITPDLQHIRELKQAIHVQEVAIAPPHEHQLIAMHRHGHRLGGLPTLFWAAIIILIVIFHLFLIKLIYNEYCGSGSGLAAVSGGYERMRRAV